MVVVVVVVVVIMMMPRLGDQRALQGKLWGPTGAVVWQNICKGMELDGPNIILNGERFHISAGIWTVTIAPSSSGTLVGEESILIILPFEVNTSTISECLAS
jgi:hypothetical protein